MQGNVLSSKRCPRHTVEESDAPGAVYDLWLGRLLLPQWRPRQLHMLKLPWKDFSDKSAILVAPTSSGKTLASILPFFRECHFRPGVCREPRVLLHVAFTVTLQADMLRHIRTYVERLQGSISATAVVNSLEQVTTKHTVLVITIDQLLKYKKRLSSPKWKKRSLYCVYDEAHRVLGWDELRKEPMDVRFLLISRSLL